MSRTSTLAKHEHIDTMFACFVAAEGVNTETQMALLLEFIQGEELWVSFARFLKSKEAPFRVMLGRNVCARFDTREKCEAFICGANQWGDQQRDFRIEERK